MKGPIPGGALQTAGFPLTTHAIGHSPGPLSRAWSNSVPHGTLLSRQPPFLQGPCKVGREEPEVPRGEGWLGWGLLTPSHWLKDTEPLGYMMPSGLGSQRGTKKGGLASRRHWQWETCSSYPLGGEALGPRVLLGAWRTCRSRVGRGRSAEREMDAPAPENYLSGGCPRSYFLAWPRQAGMGGAQSLTLREVCCPPVKESLRPSLTAGQGHTAGSPRGQDRLPLPIRSP